jgi:hypothetical protein
MLRAAAFAVPALLLLFVGLYAAAAAAYPGGTWEDPTTVGHSFLFNYYCDLMRPIALNGQANPSGSKLAEWGQLVFALSLGPFFWVAPGTFGERPRLGRSVRALGVVACIAGIGVVMMPSWRWGQTVHGILLLSCGVPAVAALVCVMVGTWRVPALRALSGALVLTMVATIAIFVRQMAIGVESSPGLAPLQRIDFALALSWMTLTSLRSERARRASSTAP